MTGTHGEFEEQWWRDFDSGVERGLQEYLQMFPGDPMRVAAEWLALEKGERERDAIGPYRVLDRDIGGGGQGSVHLAEDSRVPGKRVAIKLLHEKALGSPEGMRRFRREAEISSKMQHPGICPVFAADFHQDQAYIVMPFIEGVPLTRCIESSMWTPMTEDLQGDANTEILDLEAEIEQGRGDDRAPGAQENVTTSGPTSRKELMQVIGLIEKAARALHAAHQKGIVHRDVKPGNIMVTKGGEPVIMDFGLARDLEGDLPTLTRSGQFFGTPQYMAPEQLAHSRIPIDRRADVWALGITLYECLTGKRPFSAPTEAGMYQAIMTKEPEDPRGLNALIPRDLAVVLETALEKDRDHRYQSALDLAEDLRRVRAHEPIAARPASQWTKLVRWARRNPVVAASLSAAIFSISAGLAVALLSLARVDRALENERKLSKRLDAQVDGLRRFVLMSDSRLIRDLHQQADWLWPLLPRMLPAFDAWLETAHSVVERLPEHLVVAKRQLDEPQPNAGGRSSDPGERVTSALRNPKQRWEQSVFDETIERIYALTPLIKEIERRRLMAALIAKQTTEDAAQEWDRCLRDLTTNPKYSRAGKLRTLKPQVGLIPLGIDSESGLWEFWHVASGARPEWTRLEGDKMAAQSLRGKVKLADSSGVTLILLPGGETWMGASRDEAEPHFDDYATGGEGPVHEVRIDPFFVSKYELTHHQWTKVMKSWNAEDDEETTLRQFGGVKYSISPLDPALGHEWYEFANAVRRLGLEIPTEARWEYACRAGTRTPFWCGRDADSIIKRRAGNTKDSFLATIAILSDHPMPIGVGRLAANPFGLHDCIGNAWELCADEYLPYTTRPRVGDGLKGPEGWVEESLGKARLIGAQGPTRVVRGGSFKRSFRHARSASRLVIRSFSKSDDIGIRPCLSIR